MCKIKEPFKHEKLNKVYDVLVEYGGAPERDRSSFLTAHLDPLYPCQEWRFQGYFGFGGKYRSLTNKIDCYREDETPERVELIKNINNKLIESDEIQN